MQLRLRDPFAKQYSEVDDKEDDNCAHKNADDVASDDSTAMLLKVQETVDVEVIGGVDNVRESEVQPQYYYDRGDMQVRKRIGSWDYNFEKGEDRVEGVLGDVAEDVEAVTKR